MASSQQTKEVRFYQTVIVTTEADGTESRKNVGKKFWPKLLDKLEAKTVKQRKSTISRRDYFGAVSRPVSPAIPHLQVGRLRDVSEGLERTDMDTGETVALLLDGNQRVSEPTFVVPFSGSGRVAVMGPGLSTRATTIARWLTDVFNLALKGKSIQLAPIVDLDALALLMDSKGAVAVQFQFDVSKELASKGDNSLLGAVENVRRSGPSEGVMYVGWSMGRSGGTISDKSMLKKLAEVITTKHLANRATANLVIEDADGNMRHETHNLFEDQIVEKAKWKVDRSKPSDVSEILSAISKAMREFDKKVA